MNTAFAVAADVLFGRRCVLAFCSLFTLSLVAVAGCGKGSNSPEKEDNIPGNNNQSLVGEIEIRGVVLQSTTSGKPSKLDGAKIQAICDRDKNGVVSPEETSSTTSDENGEYVLKFPVTKGDSVVVSFSAEGAATGFRTLEVDSGGKLTLNVTLKGLESLQCSAQSNNCLLQNGKLSLSGLPEGVKGSARVFNPVAEASAFPGNFNDGAGNLLVSGVFSATYLEDQSGQPLTQLDKPADLRMEIPRDTWNVVKDIHPGSDRIEVPLYSFNEVSGQWVADGEGFLEDEAGNPVSENKLTSIRDLTYQGILMVHATVSHFSYWNVDWPVDTKSCVSAIVLRANGKPAEGATVMVKGVSYTGTSTPITLGSDGRFCRGVMRSEQPGEDLDADGKTGQATTISVTVVDDTDVYAVGSFAVPIEQATCGGSGCKDLGTIQLDEAKKLVPTVCTISGVVSDRQGNPLSGAIIYGSDESVPQELIESKCNGETIPYPAYCLPMAYSENDGSFSLEIFATDPIIGGYLVQAGEIITKNRWAERTYTGCPTNLISLILDNGYNHINNPGLTLDEDQISWNSDYKASYLVVTSASSDWKWMLATSDGDDGSISSPVIYGEAPSGNVTQSLPPGVLKPEPLVSGDSIQIMLSGRSADGYSYIGSQAILVP